MTILRAGNGSENHTSSEKCDKHIYSSICLSIAKCRNTKPLCCGAPSLPVTASWPGPTARPSSGWTGWRPRSSTSPRARGMPAASRRITPWLRSIAIGATSARFAKGPAQLTGHNLCTALNDQSVNDHDLYEFSVFAKQLAVRDTCLFKCGSPFFPTTIANSRLGEFNS